MRRTRRVALLRDRMPSASSGFASSTGHVILLCPGWWHTPHARPVAVAAPARPAGARAETGRGCVRSGAAGVRPGVGTPRAEGAVPVRKAAVGALRIGVAPCALDALAMEAGGAARRRRTRSGSLRSTRLSPSLFNISLSQAAARRKADSSPSSFSLPSSSMKRRLFGRPPRLLESVDNGSLST